MPGPAMTSSTRVVRTSIALLAVGFAALMFIMIMTLRLGDRARVTFDEVIEARDTRAAAAEARAAVQTAESSQRGYILTGNQIYLAPYGTAKATAQRDLDEVKHLLARDPDAQPALQRLTEVIAEKFAEMDRSIVLKRDRQDPEALALIRSNRGKALMDEANVFFSGISRSADERLTKGVDEQNENAGRLRWTTIASGVLIVIVVGVVAGTVLRYTQELAAAREEVAGLNRGLEKRVEERTADLARANGEIRRFAHIVSHDLRAPLVSIEGFTGEMENGLRQLRTLLEAEDGASSPGDGTSAPSWKTLILEDMPEAIGFIRSSTRRMDGMIGGVLKLSREGGRVLNPEPVTIADVVRAGADAIRHQLGAAGGSLRLDIGVSELVVDRLSLEQIVANLLDNAVKYRSPERPLTIDVRARNIAGGRVAIEVADNGRGIAERDRERIFDLFARVGRADQPGEGVGLAHVRAIVRNLGGEIAVSSAVDVGSTFRVELPARAPLHAAA